VPNPIYEYYTPSSNNIKSVSKPNERKRKKERKNTHQPSIVNLIPIYCVHLSTRGTHYLLIMLTISNSTPPTKQNLHPRHLVKKGMNLLRLAENANIELAKNSSSELHHHEHGEMSPNAYPPTGAKGKPACLDVVLHTPLLSIKHRGWVVFQPALRAELGHVRTEVGLVVVDLVRGHADVIAWWDVVLVELAAGWGNLAGQGEGDGGMETDSFAHSGFEDWVLVFAAVVAEEVVKAESVFCCCKLLANFLRDFRVKGELVDYSNLGMRNYA